MQEHIPKRGWLLAIAVGVPALVVTGSFVGLFDRGSEVADVAAGTAQVASGSSRPPASVIDDCNRSAELAAGEVSVIAPEVVSGAGELGESEPGERSGAVEDLFANEERPSDASLGMSEQTRKSAKARSVYRDCLSLKGYAS